LGRNGAVAAGSAVGCLRRRLQTRIKPIMQEIVESLKKATNSMMYFITVPSVEFVGTATL
jgi:hypothetical protein